MQGPQDLLMSEKYGGTCLGLKSALTGPPPPRLWRLIKSLLRKLKWNDFCSNSHHDTLQTNKQTNHFSGNEKKTRIKHSYMSFKKREVL